MAKYLVSRCNRCDLPIGAASIGQVGTTKLGRIVKEAAKQDRPLRIQDQIKPQRCHCSASADVPVRQDFRWTIRQMLYVMAVSCAMLMVIRSLLLGVNDWALVTSPWSMYGWLFLGTPMPVIDRGPPTGADLFLFLTNLCLAWLVAICAVVFGCMALIKGWRTVSQ